MKQQNSTERTYIAIDLKSYYASCEAVDRGLDPLTTNLVVADLSRTEKTICLAVSPSLKAYGISGRARLFEVVQKVKEINAQRLAKAPGKSFTGKSSHAPDLAANPPLELDYVVARPRMSRYMELSTQIYQIYLRFISAEDIHVYSVDEVFIDATHYLKTYGMDAREFAMTLVHEVLKETGITATAGIAPNMFLCKVAMDIMAKHIPADKDGVRIAQLDEMNYRREMWDHCPLTDFWRVGRGYAKKLEEHGMFTMGDVARCSLENEELLYKLFGINAELLIDHAWGWEPCTIAEIKAYKPQSNSIGSGQVLQQPYDFEKGKLIVREMADLLSLDLVEKGLVTDQIVLTVGYDIESLTDRTIRDKYKETITKDRYGREVPKAAHGSINLKGYTASTKEILSAVTELYTRIVQPDLLVRRAYVVANHVIPEGAAERKETAPEQLDLFTDYEALEQEKAREEAQAAREKAMQQAIVKIKQKYGKNAVLKGMNFADGATTRERNGMVGGHKS